MQTSVYESGGAAVKGSLKPNQPVMSVLFSLLFLWDRSSGPGAKRHSNSESITGTDRGH